MRNVLVALGRKALVLLAIAAHWILDDVIVILPTPAVDAVSKGVFSLTGNGYRFDEFLAFWNKSKPA